MNDQNGHVTKPTTRRVRVEWNVCKEAFFDVPAGLTDEEVFNHVFSDEMKQERDKKYETAKLDWISTIITDDETDELIYEVD